MTTEARTASGKKILVAEDEYFIAKGLVRHLAQAGAEVVGPVPTVADGITALERGAIDAAVLDVNLRGDPVYPLADALLDRGVPFVFVTGYGSGIIPERYAAVQCFEKPVEPEALVRILFGSGA